MPWEVIGDRWKGVIRSPGREKRGIVCQGRKIACPLNLGGATGQAVLGSGVTPGIGYVDRSR